MIRHGPAAHTAAVPAEREQNPMPRPAQTPTFYRLLATPIGAVGVAWREAGLAAVQLPERTPAATERRLRARSPAATPGSPPAHVAEAIALIERYLAGERVDFSAVALDLSDVADFHRRVYAAAREIGWGATSTYGALAARLGMPGAARSVGQAMGRNPIPIVIPCHRVLAAGGKAGGFSAHGGIATKQQLLALEGVRVTDSAPLLPGLLTRRG